MGFIEAMRKNKPLGIALGTAMILLAVGIMVASARSGRIPANLTRAYYSVDDGKTFFADDLNKAYPFDHDGQQAYRAYVYRGAGGVPFVAYLERYTNHGLAAKVNLLANPLDDGGAAAGLLMRDETEVKKPGTDKWVSRHDAQYPAIVRPDDPAAREVYP